MSSNSCVKFSDFHSDNVFTWCTNCGNYGIFAALKRSLAELETEPKDTLLCFDIGCNGNGADKINAYCFHGLHGRVIPFAAGASLANENVKVIAMGGDGATLSEGINHFIHAIRSDYNMTFILHNNCNYGLTTGQASATTRKGVAMNASPDGTTIDPMNVMELILGLNTTFAARTFSGDVKHMTKTLTEGMRHEGFSVIEILQSCPTYNKATPHEWYQERVYDLEEVKSYDNSDIEAARKVARDLDENIAIGILYQNKTSQDFLKRQFNRQNISTQLVEEVKNYDVSKLLQTFK